MELKPGKDPRDFSSEMAADGVNTQLGQVFNVPECRRLKTEEAVDGAS